MTSTALKTFIAAQILIGLYLSWLAGTPDTQAVAPTEPANQAHASTEKCTNVQRLENEARDAIQKLIDRIPAEQAACNKLRETTRTGFDVEMCTSLYLEKPGILIQVYEERMAKHKPHFCGRWRAK